MTKVGLGITKDDGSIEMLGKFEIPNIEPPVHAMIIHKKVDKLNDEQWKEMCKELVESYFAEKPCYQFNGKVFKVTDFKRSQCRKAIYVAGGLNNLLFEITFMIKEKKAFVGVYNQTDEVEVKYID